MDFGLSEEQTLLADSVTRFLADQVPLERVREIATNSAAVSAPARAAAVTGDAVMLRIRITHALALLGLAGCGALAGPAPPVPRAFPAEGAHPVPEVVSRRTLTEQGGYLDWCHATDLIAFERATRTESEIYTVRPDGGQHVIGPLPQAAPMQAAETPIALADVRAIVAVRRRVHEGSEFGREPHRRHPQGRAGIRRCLQTL